MLFTELLLDHGADVEALDAGGLTPIELAIKNKCNDCITAITNKLGLLLFNMHVYEYSVSCKVSINTHVCLMKT